MRPASRQRGQQLLLGDLIVAVDGVPTRSTIDMFRVIDQREVGDTVTVTLQRGDREVQVEVQLQEL